MLGNNSEATTYPMFGSKTGLLSQWPLGVITLAWALLAAPLLFIWISFRSKGKIYNLPPGPRRWPLIGNITTLMDASRPAHHIINDLAKVYGPIMLLKVGVQNLVFVTDPELAMEILKVKDHLFGNRPAGVPACKYLTYGESLISFSPQGAYHTFVRKFLVTELLASKKLQELEVLRRAELDTIVRDAFNASLRKESVDLHHQMGSVMLNLIGQVSLGKKFHGTDCKTQEQWIHLVPEITENFGLLLAESLHPSLKWLDTLIGNRKKMQETFKKVDTLLQDILDEHKKILDDLSPKELEEYKPKDLMDLILLHRNGKDSKYITDYNVKAISLDMIGGGSDTMLTVLDWAMAELLRHPEMMKRAQEEVDSVVGKDRFATEADVGSTSMPYLDAIFKETFRLHMPVPWLVPHSSPVDCKIGGYDIPANSFVNINVHGIGRSATLWNDPLKYDPDRFLNSSIDVKGGYPELMPFGRGRRICPGVGFAQILMCTVLARLIHAFDWSFPDGQTADQMDMSERKGQIASKLTPILAVPKPRLALHIYRSL